MPTAAREFLVNNRLVQPGEAFELPPGAALEGYRGLILEDTLLAPAPEPASQPAPKLRRRKRAGAAPG